MKALEKAKTDDLNEEQKKLLADLIKTEMISKIEDFVHKGNFQLVETIKQYIKTDEEEENEKLRSQSPPSKKR